MPNSISLRSVLLTCLAGAFVLVGRIAPATAQSTSNDTVQPQKATGSRVGNDATTSIPGRSKPRPDSATEWLDDYGDAMRQAEAEHKMLLLYFYDPQSSDRQRRFEAEGLAEPDVAARLAAEYIVVRLPVDYEADLEGEPSRLLDFEAFAELRGRPGVAIIDFARDAEEYHGYVVSVLPLDNGKYYRFDPLHLKTLFDLPAGTLTQRTMIFAVRIHRERPRSTLGDANAMLLREAHDHSAHQARIRNQGHHNWGSRFGRIGGALPGGLHAQEVVAESWPGEGLVDAAIDCIDSWRQSSGHWGAVRADQPAYGYDIKKGTNGIWYATGIFGNNR